MIKSSAKTPKLQQNNLKKTADVYRNPLASVLSTKLTKRNPNQNNDLFYTLGKTEMYQNNENPMKRVSSDIKVILTNFDKEGRTSYLARRNSESPKSKYFYPQATSWRYGWNC
ncbi:unnamed protein product [Diamesa serratosioi]